MLGDDFDRTPTHPIRRTIGASKAPSPDPIHAEALDQFPTPDIITRPVLLPATTGSGRRLVAYNPGERRREGFNSRESFDDHNRLGREPSIDDHDSPREHWHIHAPVSSPFASAPPARRTEVDSF